MLQTGGPVLMPWLSSVKAVLETWYAGEQMGPAIASLLWGDVNPSGRLTHSFPKAEADLPTAGSPRQYPGVFADGSTTRPPGSTEIRQVDYLEGLQVSYPWYTRSGSAPLFPFGYGLSYTTFDYSNLVVVPPLVKAGRPIRAVFRITNTGSRTGTEVAQVYLSLTGWTGEPPKRLVGWERVTLAPHRSRIVEVEINPEAPITRCRTGATVGTSRQASSRSHWRGLPPRSPTHTQCWSCTRGRISGLPP